MNSSTSSLAALKSSWTLKRSSTSLKPSGSGVFENGQLPTPDTSPVIQKRSSQQYATISTAGSRGRHSMIPDFSNPSFFESSQRASNVGKDERADKAQLSPPIALNDHWDISVAEQRQSGKRVKSRDLSFTLYVTTPTHSLTLTRTKNELIAFDNAMQAKADVTLESPLAAILADLDPSNSPPRKRRPVIFATISRTFASSKFRSAHSKAAAAAAQPPGSDETDNATALDYATHPPLAQLSSYLTKLARSVDKKDDDWIQFFRVRSRDLQSERVERRVRKMRSDPNFIIHRASTPIRVDTPETTPPKHAHPADVENRSRKDDDNDSLDFMAAISRQLSGEEADLSDNGEEEEDSPTETSRFLVTAPTSAATLNPPTGYHTPEKVEDGEIEGKANDQSLNKAFAEDKTADLIEEPENTAILPFPTSTKERRNVKSRKITLEDFEILRVLGKGCAGKVMLVRHGHSNKLYAMKAIHKHHVLAHRELLHTLTEQSVLKRVVQEGSNPFVVRLWWSFHNKENLFLVLDFHPGGDLATQLARWGRLGRDRTRFYCAEIAVGLAGLHRAGVIYRDLKPENILIGADGHCILTDFGLSKQFDRPEQYRLHSHRPTSSLDDHADTGSLKLNPPWMREIGKAQSSPPMDSWGDVERGKPYRETTTTFCGTAEYLAPEVLVGEAYSYECDAWSYGTMLYEMLTGVTPFYAEDHTSMYKRVLYDELEFDDRILDPDTRSILRGLLQKSPTLRMTDDRVHRHPYFSMIDWSFVTSKRYIPPYIPALNPDDELDTSNFDDTFLSMSPVVIDPSEEEDSKATDGDDAADKNLEPLPAFDEHGKDVFSGYSFRGDQESVLDEDSVIDETTSKNDNNMQDTKEHEDEMQDVIQDLPPLALTPKRTRTSQDENQMSGCSSSSNATLLSDNEHGHSQQSTDPSSVEHHQQPKPSNSHLSAQQQQSVLSDVQNSPIDEEQEEDWDLLENVVNVPTSRNGKRGLASSTSFFARGIPDKYVLAVKDVVRPSPRRQNSQRKGLTSIHSRLSSRSSSAEGVSDMATANLTTPYQNGAATSSPGRSSTPLKMRFKNSRASLKPSRNYSQNAAPTPSTSDEGLPLNSRSKFTLKRFQ